jgi:hypothetical protein
VTALLSRHLIPAAFSLLPAHMSGARATAMLLAIALQESKCEHRRQITGPARGFYQFEVAGVRGVLDHRSSRLHIHGVIAALKYPETTTAVALQMALEHNDVLATCFARLLLWTIPDILPSDADPQVGWQQYLKCWRPGKPHPETWVENFTTAWFIVKGRET